IFLSEMRDGLRLVVFRDVKRRPRQPFDVVSTTVQYGRGYLHDVDVDLLREDNPLGVNHPNDPPAPRQVCDDAHLVFHDRRSGVPRALEWRDADGAELTAVGEKDHAFCCRWRIELGPDGDRTADEASFSRRGDLQRRLASPLSVRHRAEEHGDKRRDASCSMPGHGYRTESVGASGTRGP